MKQQKTKGKNNLLVVCLAAALLVSIFSLQIPTVAAIEPVEYIGNHYFDPESPQLGIGIAVTSDADFIYSLVNWYFNDSLVLYRTAIDDFNGTDQSILIRTSWNENQYTTKMVIEDGYLYIPMAIYPPYHMEIDKIDLDTFAIVDTLDLPSYTWSVSTVISDGFLYIFDAGSHNKIVKVNAGTLDYVSELTPSINMADYQEGLIADGFMYIMGTNGDSHGVLARIDLSTFTEDAVYISPNGYDDAYSEASSMILWDGDLFTISYYGVVVRFDLDTFAEYSRGDIGSYTFYFPNMLHVFNDNLYAVDTTSTCSFIRFNPDLLFLDNSVVQIQSDLFGYAHTSTISPDGYVYVLSDDGDGILKLWTGDVVPTPSPSPSPPPHYLPYFDQNFYFHDQAITTNNVAGYLASPYQPTRNTTIETASTTGQVSDLYYGVRIFHVQNRTTTELTNGSPQAQVHLENTYNTSSVEELTATWSMPNRYLQFGRDALEFNLYVSFDGANWFPVAVYITDHIFSKQIFESEVTVHYYVEKYEGETTTITRFHWGGGSGNYISGVYGFMFKTATPPDWQAYYLGSGNFAMFVLAPYVVVLGNTFYGVVLLAFCMGIYIRYRNLSPVVLFVILIVGTLIAGGVNIAFGEYVVGLIWAACAFGLGLVYWRVFR